MNEARRDAEQALALHGALGQADGNPLYELGIVQRQTGAMQEARATLRARARDPIASWATATPRPRC